MIWGIKLSTNKNVQPKYLTIRKDRRQTPNTYELSNSLIQRLHWAGELRERRGTFILSDVRLSDENYYGCQLDLGMSYHNKPVVSVVQLIVTGL